MFIIDVEGNGEITPLPTQGGGDYDPSWSPDGTKIAFTSLRDNDRPQVFVLNLLDNTVVQVSQSEKHDFQPDWSPDGLRLVYISTAMGPYQVWTMSFDGTTAQRFSASGGRRNTDPAWSPGDQLIVYTQLEDENSYPILMGARYPDGGESEFRVYPILGALPMREAQFSPDGYWITFESWPDGLNHDVYMMTSNGAERTQITFDPAFDFDPVWRPISP
jgi:Tol biopolymer transport system component